MHAAWFHGKYEFSTARPITILFSEKMVQFPDYSSCLTQDGMFEATLRIRFESFCGEKGRYSLVFLGRISGKSLHWLADEP